MFDNEDDDFEAIESLIWKYQALKDGNMIGNYLDAEEFEILLDYYISNHKMKEVDEVLLFGLEIHPDAVGLLILKTEMLYDAQNFGQALKAIERIEAIHPYIVNAIILKADILVEINKYDEAIAHLEQKVALLNDFEKIEVLMALADVYDDITDFANVYQTLIRVLELNPTYQEALYKIAFWADLADKNKESIVFHEELLAKDPFNAVAWYNLASAYHSNKEYEKSIDAYQYCIDLDERVEAAYRNIADAYMRIKKFDEAIEALEKNLEIGKAEDVIYEAMGQCFEKKKDFNKARYYYRQAIKLSPADDLYFYKIAETYNREKNYAKAYESYLSAYKLNEENHQYPYAMGQCLVAMENEKEAIVYFLKSLTIKPSHKNAWIGMSRALYQLGLYEEIIMQKDVAEEHCGPRAEFEFLLAAALFALGKTKEAVVTLRTAMEMGATKFKLLQELDPEILTRKSVADIWMEFKKK